MSRYHRVKPKPESRQNQNKPSRREELSDQQQLLKTIQEATDALYAESGGFSIDAAIARAQKTLELYDRELDAVSSSDEKHRWKISPSVALRWERELERQQKRREDLRAECHAMAKRVVMEWVDEGAVDEFAPQPPQADATEDATHREPARKGGGDADAGSKAA